VREDEIQSSISSIRVLPYAARKDERPDGVALTDMDGAERFHSLICGVTELQSMVSRWGHDSRTGALHEQLSDGVS
jgi:hypothetical protein